MCGDVQQQQSHGSRLTLSNSVSRIISTHLQPDHAGAPCGFGVPGKIIGRLLVSAVHILCEGTRGHERYKGGGRVPVFQCDVSLDLLVTETGEILAHSDIHLSTQESISALRLFQHAYKYHFNRERSKTPEKRQNKRSKTTRARIGGGDERNALVVNRTSALCGLVALIMDFIPYMLVAQHMQHLINITPLVFTHEHMNTPPTTICPITIKINTLPPPPTHTLGVPCPRTLRHHPFSSQQLAA